MAYRAKSLAFNDAPAQGKVQRRALKALKRSKLMERLDDLTADMTAHVAKEMCIDNARARRIARRWVLEAVAESVYMSAGDVVFIENE